MEPPLEAAEAMLGSTIDTEENSTKISSICGINLGENELDTSTNIRNGELDCNWWVSGGTHRNPERAGRRDAVGVQGNSGISDWSWIIAAIIFPPPLHRRCKY